MNKVLQAFVGILAIFGFLLTGIANVESVSAVSAAPPPVFGMQFHGIWSSYTDTSRALVLDTMKNNGVKTVRIDVSWNGLEPTRSGAFSSWYLSQVDNLVTMANQRGMKPLITLWMAPQWANGSTDERVPPTNARGLTGLTNVSQRLALRYKGKVDSWEVWNEPNDDDFMRGKSPTVYAKVLAAAYKGFKQGDVNSIVIFGGPSLVDTVWVTQALAAGAAHKYDVMGVHPYMAVGDEDPTLPDNGTKYRLNHLPTLIQAMTKYGDGNKPIWFTEFGWRVHQTLPTDQNWQRGVTPLQQKDFLAKTLNLVQAKYPTVKKVFWYRDRTDGTDVNETGYGLIFPDGHANVTLASVSNLYTSLQKTYLSTRQTVKLASQYKVTKVHLLPVKTNAKATITWKSLTPAKCVVSKNVKVGYTLKPQTVGTCVVKAAAPKVSTKQAYVQQFNLKMFK